MVGTQWLCKICAFVPFALFLIPLWVVAFPIVTAVCFSAIQVDFDEGQMQRWVGYVTTSVNEYDEYYYAAYYQPGMLMHTIKDILSDPGFLHLLSYWPVMVTINFSVCSVLMAGALVQLSALQSIVWGAWGHVIVSKKAALLAAGLLDESGSMVEEGMSLVQSEDK